MIRRPYSRESKAGFIAGLIAALLSMAEKHGIDPSDLLEAAWDTYAHGIRPAPSAADAPASRPN